MSVQIVQLSIIVIYIILGVLAWKIKNTKWRIFIIGTVLVSFIASPVRFKQEGMSKIERRVSRLPDKLPERVISKTKTFEEKQAYEMAKLKSESKDLLND